jgi:hypothetical protein
LGAAPSVSIVSPSLCFGFHGFPLKIPLKIADTRVIRNTAPHKANKRRNHTAELELSAKTELLTLLASLASTAHELGEGESSSL